MSFNFPLTIPSTNKKSTNVQYERYNLRRPGYEMPSSGEGINNTVFFVPAHYLARFPLHHCMILLPLRMSEPGLTLCLVYCTTTTMSPFQTTAPNRRLPSLLSVLIAAYFCHASHSSTCNNQPLSYLRPPSRPA